MSRDALLHCAHIFLRVSRSSPSISLCLSLPLSHWQFVFGGIWDPIHWAAIVRLLSAAEDGPREAEWLSVGAPLQDSCSLPYDDVMAFLCSGGTHWFPLPLLHTLYICLLPCFHPLPQPPVLYSSASPLFPDSLASQKAPGGFRDVWMLFSTPTIHAWHSDRRAIKTPQIQRTSYLNRSNLTSALFSLSCDQLFFSILGGFSAGFVFQ